MNKTTSYSFFTIHQQSFKMIQQILIKQETSNDYEEVFKINTNAFGQEGEAKLVDALRKNKAVFVPELSLVALKDNQIVGHILFTKIYIQDLKGNQTQSLALAPMAVASDVQKMGIGSLLVKKGLEIAQQLQFKSVIVLGHEHYYPRFGFKPCSLWNIKPPFEVPQDVFMAIELEKNGLQNTSGTVIYPKEFESV